MYWWRHVCQRLLQKQSVSQWRNLLWGLWAYRHSVQLFLWRCLWREALPEFAKKLSGPQSSRIQFFVLHLRKFQEAVEGSYVTMNFFVLKLNTGGISVTIYGDRINKLSPFLVFAAREVMYWCHVLMKQSMSQWGNWNLWAHKHSVQLFLSCTNCWQTLWGSTEEAALSNLSGFYTVDDGGNQTWLSHLISRTKIFLGYLPLPYLRAHHLIKLLNWTHGGFVLKGVLSLHYRS